jgi:hypothetical protein
MIEDYPLWLKLTANNFHLDFMEYPTVFYRISDSLSKNTVKIGNVEFLSCMELIYSELIWPNIKGFHKIKIVDDKIMFKSKNLTIYLFANKKSIWSTFFYSVFFMFRPYRFFVWFLSKF